MKQKVPVSRPVPAMDPVSLALWRKLIDQARARGDVHAALDLEMLLGAAPQ